MIWISFLPFPADLKRATSASSSSGPADLHLTANLPPTARLTPTRRLLEGDHSLSLSSPFHLMTASAVGGWQEVTSTPPGSATGNLQGASRQKYSTEEDKETTSGSLLRHFARPFRIAATSANRAEILNVPFVPARVPQEKNMNVPFCVLNPAVPPYALARFRRTRPTPTPPSPRLA